MSNIQNAAAQSILNMNGVNGGKAITGTSKVSPSTGKYFAAITATAATVVASQEDVDGSDNPTLTAIPVGTTVYGKFSSITLTSGTAIGYYGTL